MAQYSIKELETLSGIKAHTLRIWEKRHNILRPQRTETNIRYYTDEDLRRIINVSLLNNSGIKISRIAVMSPDQIHAKVREISETQTDADTHIEGLVLAMLSLNEERFEQALAKQVLRFGFERTIVEIVYPFLERIGVLWQTGNISPAQEHFISNLVRQKLIVAIDGLPLAAEGKSAILFLPEHELHELGLLFYHYLVRKQGLRTFYLGQVVPHADLKTIFQTYGPDYLITCLTSQVPGGAEAYLKKLTRDFQGTRILVGGVQAILPEPLPPGVQLIRKALDINHLLNV
jgi:DNA-binding transcriptional MerR regulator